MYMVTVEMEVLRWPSRHEHDIISDLLEVIERYGGDGAAVSWRPGSPISVTVTLGRGGPIEAMVDAYNLVHLGCTKVHMLLGTVTKVEMLYVSNREV